MIILNLKGGMGNQMFQYAFGRYLAIKHNTELKFDFSFLNERKNIGNRVIRNFDLDIFGIDENLASKEEVKTFTGRTGIVIADKALAKLFGHKRGHVVEMDLHFSPAYFNSPADVYLDGYFASEKYFAPAKEEIKKEFTVKEPLTDKAREMMERINQNNAVCVNVRRGDFVTNPTHNVCGIEYYAAAEKLLLEKQPGARFFVFSDEVEWCEKNLRFSVPTTFVSHDYKGRKFQDYFRLMIACRHFIIPNSTFAWWATYLNNRNDKIVVAPKRWLNIPGFTTDDILPKDWIRLDV